MINFDTFWDKKAFNLRKKAFKVLNDLKICYTYFNIYFAIFGSELFHQIVFKTSKSRFL